MKSNLKLMALVAALSASAFASAATVTVDTFSVGQAKLTDETTGDGGFYSSVTGAATDILGGVREIYVENLGGAPGEVSAVVNGSPFGFYSYSSDSLVAGTSTIRWDGVASGTNVGGSQGAFSTRDYGLNANLSQLSAFELVVLNADVGFSFAISMFQKDDVTNTVYSSTVKLTSSGGVGTRYIPLMAFFAASGFYDDPYNPMVNDGMVQVINNGFNFMTATEQLADINALEAVVVGNTNFDLSITNAAVVPEPASVGLTGLALLGLFGTRRRNRAKV